ncbi:CRISPR-associated endonuclease Cas2 [Desulfurobacterium atlanticum]|uniref:CRISPR-associated endoribonuclease Cas2 n=1 Tax=Desulfurobacterium atlanticum TaxID=240169 RepID=A0A238Y530_9BACT|nr:CRISPR-associated endonuclease Cas2 [Desulfurobacterium atlanticum]SNR65918.1 CRISPR-associated protein, Cas2 family [Desulfurobacterium atlanticum]
MRYLIVYDISNDRARNKISTKLKKYGKRIQYSAFEIEIASKEIERLINEMEKLIDNTTDSIFLFPLSSYLIQCIIKLGKVDENEVAL